MLSFQKRVITPRGLDHRDTVSSQNLASSLWPLSGSLRNKGYPTMGANPAFLVEFVFLFFLFALSKLMPRWELSQTRARQDPHGCCLCLWTGLSSAKPANGLKHSRLSVLACAHVGGTLGSPASRIQSCSLFGNGGYLPHCPIRSLLSFICIHVNQMPQKNRTQFCPLCI